MAGECTKNLASPCLAFGEGVWRYLWRQFYRGYQPYPASISCNCAPASGVAPHPHIIYHLASVLKLVQCLHMSSRIIHAILFIVIASVLWECTVLVLVHIHVSKSIRPLSLPIQPALQSPFLIYNLVLLGGWLLLDEVVSWVILEVEGVACYVLVNGPGKREESTYWSQQGGRRS